MFIKRKLPPFPQIMKRQRKVKNDTFWHNLPKTHVLSFYLTWRQEYYNEGRESWGRGGQK